MDKLNTIKNIIHNNGCIYMPIYNDESINNIYELLVNNVVYEPIHNVDYVYLGIYYGEMQKDPLLMKKYLKHAIKQDDLYALYYYCLFLQAAKNREKVKKYLLLGINKNITLLAGYLGIQYQMVDHDYVNMKKYYDMIIDKDVNCIDMLNNQYNYTTEDYEYTKIAIIKMIFDMEKLVYGNLGYYYQYTDENYELMEFYYSKAIEKGCMISMTSLGHYYKYIHFDTKKAKYYYSKAIEGGNKDGYTGLAFCYKEKLKYEKMKLCFLQNMENPTALSNMVDHYGDIEKNYKMIKMYVTMYYNFNEDYMFGNITGHFYDKGLQLLLLECYLNSQNKDNRINIIRLFNVCANKELSIKDNIIFKQLIEQYEFMEGDELNRSMIKILELEDKYKIIFKDLIEKFAKTDSEQKFYYCYDYEDFKI